MTVVYAPRAVRDLEKIGAYYRANGIDVGAAEKHAAKHGSLQGFTEADPISPDDLLTLKCDVLVPDRDDLPWALEVWQTLRH